ncbi:MAG: STAS domain-containing protein [Planctomycetota bacterium]
MPPSGHLIIQVYDGVILVKITKDRVLEAAVISAISAELMGLLDRHPNPSIVLDMADVAYLSSAMIGKLIALYKAVIAHKGRLAIGGVRESLVPLFKITQIDRLIKFYPEARAAIMQFKKTA